LIGVLGMVPRWWHQRRVAARAHEAVANLKPVEAPNLVPPHGL